MTSSTLRSGTSTSKRPLASSAMRKVSLRNIGAHKLRLFLTVLSVVLGTAFVAGALVFTGTVKNSFNGIFDKTAIGVDTQISSADSSDQAGVPNAVVTALTENKTQLGINRVVPQYSQPAVVAKKGGGRIQSGGAPSLAAAYLPPDQALNPADAKLFSGGAAPQPMAGDTPSPSAPVEAVINKSAAERGNLAVGDITQALVERGANSRPFAVKIVGITDLPGATSGFTLIQFNTQTAAKLLSDGNSVGSVELSAAPGVTPEQLRDRVSNFQPAGQQKNLGDQFKVQTGQQVRDDAKKQVNSFLNIFNYILQAFGAIGLIVGIFLIYNTFSMIVAQRIRELALLRAIGTSRGQIVRSVLLEASIVGLVGGLIGLAAGIGIGAALKTLLSSGSTGLPEGPLVIGPTPVIASLAVGIIVTVISALAPALRASSIPPVEAMRESMTDGAQSIKRRTIIGAVLGAIGIAIVVAGTTQTGNGAMGIVGLGALIVIIAIVFGAPALSRPAVKLLSFVFAKPFGKIGQLAQTNAVRNPRRTAATAFALTLGLMLVAVIGTFGSSFKGAINSSVDQGMNADLVISSSQGGVPPMVANDISSQIAGIDKAVGMGVVTAKVGDDTVHGYAPRPSADTEAVSPYTMEDVAPSTIPDDGMLVSAKTAASKGWKVGDTISMTSVDTSRGPVPVKITGIFKDTPFTKLISLDWMVGQQAYEQLMPTSLQQDAVVLLKVKPGTSVATVQNSVEDLAKPYLSIKVQTKSEFKGEAGQQIDTMMTVLSGMLGLALLIAVIGIVNTLALSVIERKREIGMLRALGMSRAQVQRTIYIESVLIALFGAILGTVLGGAFGWAMMHALRNGVVTEAVIPWGRFIVTIVAAAVVGVLAAAWPAIRAARTKPLEAIADM